MDCDSYKAQRGGGMGLATVTPYPPRTLLSQDPLAKAGGIRSADVTKKPELPPASQYPVTHKWISFSSAVSSTQSQWSKRVSGLL